VKATAAQTLHRGDMTLKVRKQLVLAFLCLVIGMTVPASAQNKYSRYIKATPEDLFQRCVSNSDDIACYFYGGLKKKRGKLADAHDAYFLGAQLAKERAGFVCMLELARMYEKGDGVRRDPVQSYRWYTVLMNDQPAKDLRAAASNKRKSIAVTMTTDQIAAAEAMARAWKAQSGT
jgi:hypothetical protein